jgi:hypothetical protein
MQRPRIHINRKIICAALLLVSLIPVVVAGTVTVRHWAPLPYWDEWRTPGLLLTNYAKGTLRFSDFFLQHNEARMAFPCILYFTLTKFHGWDMRDVMTVALFEDTVICGLVLWLFLRTKGATVVPTLVAFAVTTFLCFSPVQYENFLSGFLFALFLPGLATVLVAVVNLSRFPFGVKTTINAVVALIATYTFANGMLLWILGVPLPAAEESASKRRRLVWYSIFALMGAVAIAAYFFDYQRPPSHPLFHFDLIQLAHYIILWVGGYFNSAQVSPFAVGLLVLTLWIVALASAIMLLKRGAQWRHFYPWFLISFYGLSSGFITAIGRVGFGVQQSLSSRYAILSLFVYVGLVGIIFALYCYDQDRAVVRRRRWIIGLAIALIALAVPAWIFCLRRGEQLMVQMAQRSARLHCALEWMDVFPTNPDLKLIFPYLNVLRMRAHAVADAGSLRLHIVSPQLFGQLKESRATTDMSYGCLETAVIRENSLMTSGWIRSFKERSDCVIIGLRKPTGQLELLSVIAPTPPTSDTQRPYGTRPTNAVEFWDKTSISTSAQGVIEAWAVDARAEAVWPLAGSQRLSPRP